MKRWLNALVDFIWRGSRTAGRTEIERPVPLQYRPSNWLPSRRRNRGSIVVRSFPDEPMTKAHAQLREHFK